MSDEHVPYTRALRQQRDPLAQQLSDATAANAALQKSETLANKFREQTAMKNRKLSDENSELKAVAIALREQLAASEAGRERMGKRLERNFSRDCNCESCKWWKSFVDEPPSGALEAARREWVIKLDTCRETLARIESNWDCDEGAHGVHHSQCRACQAKQALAALKEMGM